MADDKKKEPAKGVAGGIDADKVRELNRLLAETGLDEIEYAGPDWRVRVVRRAAAPAPVAPAAAPTAPAPAAASVPQAAESIANHPGVVKSPMVGVAYTAPDPATPPFIRVGDQVTEGQTLLLIEAMKVFNPIKAPRAGKVARIFITSGTPVEYGEPLVLIE
ncbi:MAG: acetyl-CoA carboxylase biotin carboxyl carrier protein [Acidimicrobiia bacterium]|nr:acetyl-CoA carboxylase biotin carboxyl carrier protein [Acidimicrobiia bacterium]